MTRLEDNAGTFMPDEYGLAPMTEAELRFVRSVAAKLVGRAWRPAVCTTL